MAWAASGHEGWRLGWEVLGLPPQPWSCWWTGVSEDPAENLTQLWSRGMLQFEIREEQTDMVHDINDTQNQQVMYSCWVLRCVDVGH